MGLSVISGPPGSGREEVVLERFTAALGADPLLVAPTADDVDRLERELCKRGGAALLGGAVLTFPALFEEVRRASGVEAAPAASRMQRVWLARAAAREAELRLLRRSARRDGFALALEALIADLQAAGLDAAALECGAHWPYREAFQRQMAAHGQTPTALHNNCSGKHAGFVCIGCLLAAHAGQDARAFVRGYLQPQHPVMRVVSAAIARATGADLGAAPVGDSQAYAAAW